MKKKAQVYRCAESVAKMLELEELHTLRLKSKQEEWTQLLQLSGDLVEARGAVALKPPLSAVCLEVTQR